MLLSTVLCVFLACGFAMFHLANAASFVLAVAVLSVAEALLLCNLGNFDGNLLNGVAAMGALQFGYFTALAVAACRVRLESAMGVVDGAGEA